MHVPFYEKFRQNGAKVEIQKFGSNVSCQILVEKLYSKFQAKILKNVGRDAFLVTVIGQKAQTEIWLIL